MANRESDTRRVERLVALLERMQAVRSREARERAFDASTDAIIPARVVVSLDVLRWRLGSSGPLTIAPPPVPAIVISSPT